MVECLFPSLVCTGGSPCTPPSVRIVLLAAATARCAITTSPAGLPNSNTRPAEWAAKVGRVHAPERRCRLIASTASSYSSSSGSPPQDAVVPPMPPTWPSLRRVMRGPPPHDAAGTPPRGCGAPRSLVALNTQALAAATTTVLVGAMRRCCSTRCKPAQQGTMPRGKK
jgi:hypothetical protein